MGAASRRPVTTRRREARRTGADNATAAGRQPLRSRFVRVEGREDVLGVGHGWGAEEGLAQGGAQRVRAHERLEAGGGDIVVELAAGTVARLEVVDGEGGGEARMLRHAREDLLAARGLGPLGVGGPTRAEPRGVVLWEDGVGEAARAVPAIATAQKKQLRELLRADRVARG